MTYYLGNEPTFLNNKRDYFAGTGSATNFTLSSVPGGANALLIFVAGAIKTPGVDYYVEGKVLTFIVAPPTPVGVANNIEVIFLQRMGVPTKTSWKVPIADNTGTADALVASYTPGFTGLEDNMLVYVVTSTSNSTTTPSLSVDGLPAKTIVMSDGSAVIAGSVTGTILTRYDLGLDKWVFANPVIPQVTPPQFDNDTSLASTAFVKRQGLEASSVTTLTSNTTLTAASHAGSIILLNPAAGGVVITLPAKSTFPNGGLLEFCNISAYDVTVQRAGSDLLYKATATTVTSITVKAGDTLVLCTGSTANAWYIEGGSTQLQTSGSFKAVLASNGYQKFPSGVIIQWGTTTVTSSGTGTTGEASVTFPVTFPTAATLVNSMQDQDSGAIGGCIVPYYRSLTTSGVILGLDSASASDGPFPVKWISIGY